MDAFMTADVLILVPFEFQNEKELNLIILEYLKGCFA